MDDHNAYPLDWPVNWPRTVLNERKRASFGSMSNTGWGRKALSLSVARERLQTELARLLGWDYYAVLSTNARLRRDGAPYSNDRPPEDPGAAVYFTMDEDSIALACDKWDRLPDNVAAIAAHIGAMRGMDRWGVGDAKKAFAGYKALPETTQTEKSWGQVLGVAENSDWAEIKAQYIKLAKENHPDSGGNHRDMALINRAYEQAKQEKNSS